MLPSRWSAGVVVAVAALAWSPAQAASGRDQASVSPFGNWVNSARSLVVETAPCGTQLCGHIVWASPEAVKDGAESGVASLIGLELLSDYAPRQDGSWRGKVYVPDLGGRFASVIKPMAAGKMNISGCLVGLFLCKSQTWRRL